MDLELFNPKAHWFVTELLDEAEDRLVRQRLCEPHEANDHVALTYIATCGEFIEHATVYLDNDERIAADLFLSKLAIGRMKAKFRRNGRTYAKHLATNTLIYFPKFIELLTLSYLGIIQWIDDADTLRRNGIVKLAAAMLPGVLTDVRRELRRRGDGYDWTIVPDDILQRKLGQMRPIELNGRTISIASLNSPKSARMRRMR